MYQRLRVELVVADRGWILERIADEIKAQCPREWEVRITDQGSEWADLRYSIPYSKQSEVGDALKVCYFTHQEEIEPAKSNFIEQARLADFCVAPSKKYTELLKSHGITEIETITTGVDLNKFDVKLRVGVVGRTYHTGRKGEDLVKECMDMGHIEFLFTGTGWPGPARHLGDDELPEFYRSLDVLLVPSRIEGGPVPLMEALAVGCPVIAPSDIGFVAEFPHIPFENGNVSDLRRVLEEMVSEKLLLRESVLDFSWESFALKHVDLFQRLAVKHNLGQNQEPQPTVNRIYLVSHGSEVKNKGGPSTRIGLIAEDAKRVGLDAVTLSNATQLSGRDTHCSVVHLFNCWPLRSALQQLRLAKDLGYRVIFSPIALNLEYYDLFTHTVPELLRSDAGLQELEFISKRLRRASDYDKHKTLVPSEGVRAHFDYLKALTAEADGVIYLSEYEKQFLTRIGSKSKSHVVIENCVDAELMAGADPDLFRKQYNLDNYVLVVGRIEPRKNQACIAAAFAESDVNVVMLGHSGDQRYLDLSLSLGGARVIHVDRIDDPELLASAYAGAGAFLMASWSEGAPLAALEAACAGVPLVLSNQSSESEYFSEDARYVNPLDLREIRETTREVLQLASSQGIEARKELSAKYVKRFHRQLHSMKSFQFYEDVITASESYDTTEKETILDVTHWAHASSNGIHPTGVTRVEETYARELIANETESKFLVWNSPNRVFLKLSADDILANQHVLLANAPEIPREHAAKTLRTKANIIEIDVRSQIGKSSVTSTTLVSKIKDHIESVFDNVDQSGLGLRGILQTYYPSPISRALFLSKYLSAKVAIKPLRWLDEVRAGKRQTANTSNQRLAVKLDLDTHQKMPVLGRQSTLLLLGQPWISNDKYLQDLINFVEIQGLHLKTMVQDLLYITYPSSHKESSRLVYRRRLFSLLEISSSLLVSSDLIGKQLNQLLRYKGLEKRVEKFSYASMELIAPPVHQEMPCRGPYLLFVSSINARKNHAFLLGVWLFLKQNNRIPDANLYLVGRDQSEGELKALFQSAQEYGVQHLDNVDDRKLASLYHGAAATVYPSESEGWGLPIQESVSYGKPVIAGSKCPAALEISSPLITRLESNDFFAWCEALERALDCR